MDVLQTTACPSRAPQRGRLHSHVSSQMITDPQPYSELLSLQAVVFSIITSCLPTLLGGKPTLPVLSVAVIADHGYNRCGVAGTFSAPATSF